MDGKYKVLFNLNLEKGIDEIFCFVKLIVYRKCVLINFLFCF